MATIRLAFWFWLVIINTDPKLLGVRNELGFNTAMMEVGGQAVLGRQGILTTPWLTERHGYDPT